MLPIRRLLPPIRLRPRRRHHAPRSGPSARQLAGPPVPAGGRPRTVPPGLAVATAMAVALGCSLLTTAAGAVAPAGASPGQADPGEVSYIPPVDAPIGDPFRPPASAYGPGNRGLEYVTEAGTPVVASADGTVTFAGVVAGSRHVTILHADGVRTSYSFLADVGVVRGQRVSQGDRVGTAGDRLHFGARAGDAYFDPAALFTGSTTEVELLPFEVPPGSTPDAEARALALVAFTEGGGLSLPGLDGALDWLRDTARSSVHYVAEFDPVVRGMALANDVVDTVLFPPPCSKGPPPTRPAAGQRRVAVTVAGLGSSSTSGSIDELRVDELGYEPGSVVRFSYAGGRTPGTGASRAELAGLPAHAYESDDTQGDLRIAASRLADLVEQAAAADPDAVVDVHAHSLGGVVTRLALAELHARGFEMRRLGVVVTLGTPHRGTDVATAMFAANLRVIPNVALEAAEAALDTGLDPDATAVRQLAEHSDVVDQLAVDGVPLGVRLVSIAARGDLVVASPHTRVAGATNVTLPVSGLGAHGDLVGSDAATAEIARALAGVPPGCEGTIDALVDVLAGHAISAGEDAAGAALATAGP
jgi:triacylglycerol esterase/lipase EstA (alpha/beta hydrolase family)